jgi:regulatory protein
VRPVSSKRPPKPLDVDGLMAYAARLLTGRALSVSEMRERLKRRAATAGDADLVIARLRDSGYLSDPKLAQSVASWKRENQGVGQGRVLRDLLVRRVAPSVARAAAEAAYAGVDEIPMIEKFLARKYRGKDLGTMLAEEKHLASAYRKLRVAGFSSGNSIRVLKRYAAEAERLEEMEE